MESNIPSENSANLETNSNQPKISDEVSSIVKRKPEEILLDLLRETGVVSIKKLKSKLRESNHFDVDQIVATLGTSNSKWRKVDRSFCTPEKHSSLEKEEGSAEYNDPDQESTVGSDPEGSNTDANDLPLERKSRAAKERRLCDQYILPFLRSLYFTEHKKYDYEVAFSVQNQRPSSQFRNVDLIAVNWRNDETAELVTVEAKLEFNSQLVQQAANYSRFSHRVWIAVEVEPGLEVEEIVPDLREKDALLFEYVLSLGLGIIACQRARGGSFDCYPVQWPQKQEPDSFEKQTFMECYRDTFEKAGLIPPVRKIGRVA